MVTSKLDLLNFFVKGNKLREVNPFFNELSSQHTKYIWENQKNNKKQQ